jgi:hypothetical protein
MPYVIYIILIVFTSTSQEKGTNPIKFTGFVPSL